MVAAVEAGDRVALAKLVKLVVNLLRRHGAYDHSDSWDDVCQEVLVKLVRAVGKGGIRNPGAFVSLADTVTYRTFVDWIRRTRNTTRGRHARRWSRSIANRRRRSWRSLPRSSRTFSWTWRTPSRR